MNLLEQAETAVEADNWSAWSTANHDKLLEVLTQKDPWVGNDRERWLNIFIRRPLNHHPRVIALFGILAADLPIGLYPDEVWKSVMTAPELPAENVLLNFAKASKRVDAWKWGHRLIFSVIGFPADPPNAISLIKQSSFKGDLPKTLLQYLLRWPTHPEMPYLLAALYQAVPADALPALLTATPSAQVLAACTRMWRPPLAAVLQRAPSPALCTWVLRFAAPDLAPIATNFLRDHGSGADLAPSTQTLQPEQSPSGWPEDAVRLLGRYQQEKTLTSKEIEALSAAVLPQLRSNFQSVDGGAARDLLYCLIDDTTSSSLNLILYMGTINSVLQKDAQLGWVTRLERGHFVLPPPQRQRLTAYARTIPEPAQRMKLLMLALPDSLQFWAEELRTQLTPTSSAPILEQRAILSLAPEPALFRALATLYDLATAPQIAALLQAFPAEKVEAFLPALQAALGRADPMEQHRFIAQLPATPAITPLLHPFLVPTAVPGLRQIAIERLGDVGTTASLPLLYQVEGEHRGIAKAAIAQILKRHPQDGPGGALAVAGGEAGTLAMAAPVETHDLAPVLPMKPQASVLAPPPRPLPWSVWVALSILGPRQNTLFELMLGAAFLLPCFGGIPVVLLPEWPQGPNDLMRYPGVTLAMAIGLVAISAVLWRHVAWVQRTAHLLRMCLVADGEVIRSIEARKSGKTVQRFLSTQINMRGEDGKLHTEHHSRPIFLTSRWASGTKPMPILYLPGPNHAPTSLAPIDDVACVALDSYGVWRIHSESVLVMFFYIVLIWPTLLTVLGLILFLFWNGL